MFAFSVAYPAWLKAATRRPRLVDPDYSPPRPLAIVDVIYRPDAYAASQIVEAGQVIPAPAPAADPHRVKRV